MTQRMSLLLSAVVSAVLFTAGYLVGALVPGGGDVTDEDFTDFYASDGEITTALALAYVLVAGCLALIWFFTELRTRLPDDVLSRVTYASAVFGAACVAIGGVLLLAPGSAQLFSDREFLGVDVAHAFAMAGFGIMLIPGMGAFALATALVSLSFLRSGMAPAWLAIVGLVVAVILLGSIIWLPAFIFPVWVLLVGLVGLRDDTTAAAAVPARP